MEGFRSARILKRRTPTGVRDFHRWGAEISTLGRTTCQAVEQVHWDDAPFRQGCRLYAQAVEPSSLVGLIWRFFQIAWLMFSAGRRTVSRHHAWHIETPARNHPTRRCGEIGHSRHHRLARSKWRDPTAAAVARLAAPFFRVRIDKEPEATLLYLKHAPDAPPLAKSWGF